MHRLSYRLGLSGLLLAAALAPSAAQVDPKAKAVLDEVSKAYKTIAALHEKVVFTTETKNAPPDTVGQEPLSIEIKLQRPNKLFVDFQRKGPAGKPIRDLVVSDGNNLYRYTGQSHTQSKERAPSTHIAIVKLPDVTPECDLLFRAFDPFVLFNMGAKVTLGAPEKIMDLDVDVVMINMDPGMAQGSATMKVLIGQKDHLLRSIQYDVTAKDPMSGKDVVYKVTMKYETVNAAPTFADADFKFSPPAGAKTVQPGTIEVKPGAGPKP